MNALRLGLAACAIGLTITAWIALSSGSRPSAGERPAETAVAPSAEGPAPVVAAVSGTPAAAPAAAAAPAPQMRFPGGQTLPPLNGVRESVDIAWPPHRPFAPMTKVVRDQGQDWYLHADGSWTTTVIDPNDREHSIGLVFTPEQVRRPVLRGN